MRVEEIVIKTCGAKNYIFDRTDTVGQLKKELTRIIEDLPEDDDIKIAELFLKEDAIQITFADFVDADEDSDILTYDAGHTEDYDKP